MAIKLVLAAILVASIHGQFPSNAQVLSMVRQQFQQPAAQPARPPLPVYQPPQPQQQQQVYQPPQQQYQPPAAPQPRQPMSPQQTYMNQMMTMNQNPNLRNQQNQMAQNVARNNPQLARGIAGMTSSFAQHMGQMNHQAPVQQAQAQPQPQPRVVSPFVPNQAQMAAFQSMFGGAKPAAAARPAAPVAPPKPRIDRRLSPCQYTLRNTIATKPTLTNGASGFTMKSRSRAGQVKAGSPVEVSIAPFSEAYQHLNFTSFIMYAKPTSNMAAVPEYMMEFMPPVAPTVNKHVGVFQVFRQYAAGAGAMKCSPTSKQEDSVGAFEDLILPESQPKPARNKVSVLWWPDAEALKYPEVIFTANIQSNGYWYKISSTPWKVIRPIDIQARTELMFKRFNWLTNYMRTLEQRLDKPQQAA